MHGMVLWLLVSSSSLAQSIKRLELVPSRQCNPVSICKAIGWYVSMLSNKSSTRVRNEKLLGSMVIDVVFVS